MPKRELKYPKQIEEWLSEWGNIIEQPASLTLIGSGALLWHAAQLGVETPLPENSMGVDPVTDSEEIAELCLLLPKLKRNEPRDRKHAEWAKTILSERRP